MRMRAVYIIILMMLKMTLADIGEKLRLGHNVKNVPKKNFNAGLQAPGSTFRDNIAEATSHSGSNGEDNLERLCNDPFHSFLCKPVGPRKNIFDGRLRPGAQVPSNLKSGEAQLAAGIQSSFSFDSPSFADGPSNQYLPSKFEPLPPRQENLQLLVPIQQPQQNVFNYAPPPPAPVITTTTLRPTTFRPFTTQPPKPPVQTFPPSTTKSPQFTFPVQTPPPLPSNSYLPVDQIDVRQSSSSNLFPLLQGSAQLSTGIPFRPLQQQGEAQLAEGIPASTPLRQGGSNLAEGRQNKEERHHTLEELCNDAFHSFLCKPITKPRKRIDGRIRPGAKIPPNVLQALSTSGSNAQKLPPRQQTGSAQLAEGIPNPNTFQGYYYPVPEIIPTFTFQATNQLPVQNFLIPNQKVTPEKVPERIPPPKYQSFTSQATSQQSFQNFLVPKPKVTPDKVPERIPPPKFQLSNQNSIQTNQVQNFLTTKIPPPSTQNLFSSSNQLSQNLFTLNPYITSTPCIHTPVIYQNPIAEPAQISQLTLLNSVNQLNQDGYQYSTPQAPFTFPTTTQKPITSTNILFIPSFNNEIVSTTERPTESTTNGYDYPKPSTPFTIPPRNYQIQTETQSAIPSNNQPSVITTPRPQLNNGNEGYYYQKPEQQFTLPTTTTTTAAPTDEGYSYPKPGTPFTLPARTQLTNGPQFNTVLTPVVYNQQYQIPVNTILSEDTNGDDPLPPASQFVILKP
ncbi:hypothetical protein O3M35_003262 [Rhynocoris fuscipes]|uniref:Uncharacterized protein n=1 Tax=Rhynocoris fuscipes TaxID=488301 RepID=A0AAW1CLV3_9HEMI